jgi:hypothetical protein
MIVQRSRAWLPANAVRDTVLACALESQAQLWAGRWFSSAKPISVRTNETKGRVGVASEAMCWSSPGGDLFLAMAPTAHVVIGGGMLDIDAAAHKLSANDHAMLRNLAALCVRDLLSSIGSWLDLAPDIETTSARETHAKFRHAISLGSASQVLELFLDEDVAITARKKLAPATAAAGTPLCSRESAVSRQTIQVGALVGLGHLGVGDLRTLKHGDVLVLDRGPEDELGLAIDGVRQVHAACSITQDGDHLKMRINSTRNGGLHEHGNTR